MRFPHSSPKASRRPGVSFFLRSCFRTNYIVSNSLLLFLDLLILVGMVARYRSQLTALSVFLFVGVAFGLLSFWHAVLRVHQAVHELVTSERFPMPEPGSDTDRAFGTVAALGFQGLFSSFGLVMLCLMAVGEILRTH